MFKKLILAGLAAAFLFSACKKDTEELQSAPISDYAPLQVGKYITYQLDSFRYLPFSLQGAVNSYQVKYLTDAEITDNLGRPAYRIVRHIRKTGTEAWTPDNSFTAINTGNTFEFIDENMRFLKLHLPIRNGYSWKGNSYINTTSQYSELTFLDSWDYTYDSLGASITLNGLTIDSTVKVAQRDEMYGNPEDPNAYSEINFGVEYYAKNIGLVYKRFFHSEYQPATTVGGTGYYSDNSKGLTLTMIDHN